MASLSLSFLSGAENTFIFLNGQDDFSANWWMSMSPEKKKKMATFFCEALTKKKKDGFVFFKKSNQKNEYQWEFMNSDGSWAEMCGNAARCATLFAREKMNQHETFRLATTAGQIVCDPKELRVQMTPPSGLKNQGDCDWVDTGVPHYLVSGEKNQNTVKSLRPQPPPHGSNVTFYEIQSPNSAKAVTFERGVEDYTRACGTGAVAVAVLMKLKSPNENSFSVQMPGGELNVSWATGSDRPWLSGPTEIVSDFFYPIESADEGVE